MRHRQLRCVGSSEPFKVNRRIAPRWDSMRFSQLAKLGDDGDPVRPVKCPKDRMPVSVEVVHDDVQPPAARIAREQAAKGRQNVPRRLPAWTCAHQP
jgi:hypothetical protein